MIPLKIKCEKCNAEIEIRTYRTHTVCAYCNNHIPFDGFDYRDIDWKSSMYAATKKWTTCPACRSDNMYLGSEGKEWKCPDCGYRIGNLDLMRGVLWFCDECETYMNVQPGFTTKDGKWKCTVCGFENNVTKKDII